jgi:hypothetical protein
MAHVSPLFLPDRRRFLYTVVGEQGPSVHAGSLESPDRQPVLSNAPGAALVADYIFFIRYNALTVQPFDVDRLEARGDALQLGVPAARPGRGGVDVGSASGGDAVRAFSLSSAGILAYQTGPRADSARPRLLWFDRTGLKAGVVGEPANYGDLNLSPDVATDDQRILVNTPGEGDAARPITLVNWRGQVGGSR